jgi:hypothetical protein
MTQDTIYKLSLYVPASHLEQVKEALFAAGAGQFKGYDHCCWQTLGEGQFRPLAGSQPYLGETAKLERVVEYKVEMICSAMLIRPALQALLKAHPYEQPAYEVYQILSF